jgi:hypothetical protein
VVQPLTTYLQSLQEIRRSHAGLPEPSSYPVLRTLFNEIGKTLTPKVLCIINLKDRGAGLPDGGLFTPDQLQRDAEGDRLPSLTPARGVIEIKAASDDVFRVAESKQVAKYLARYNQVLVTNYWAFLLVGQDANGDPAKLESYRLAESETTFWAASTRKLAQTHGKPFSEYLSRVMRHAAPLTSPQDVAEFMAAYAREARARIRGSTLPALASIRAALEDALGITFQGDRGDHFFQSTLIQTLFYGVFSAWVLWSKQHRPTDRARFDWQKAAYHLRVPVLRKLFYELADPGQLQALELAETLEWAGAVLNRVDRATFFKTFAEGWAVQYFYEPFLEHFDPELRKELGVWYTPPEIVQYMVARVDAVLRAELGVEGGLADPNVYVLDLCCGTGAYLVEVLRTIAATLKARGENGLLGADLKRAAMERVFGFEILPAPFVVSHLQLGLLLQGLGVPLSDETAERVGVYLTNALTGWEPPKEPKTKFLFPELKEEYDAAEKVKREVPILVIVGNPPYNGFAGIAVGEERHLTTAYRTTRQAPAPQGQGLNDLYVRFFRMAERRIVDQTGRGVVCFISNYSWLDGLSFTGMRERYLEAFDRIWIDCLNGDKFKTGKLTPQGEPDPSVFSTESNREGIQVGTAIALLVRKAAHAQANEVRFRHLWGKTKRAQLLETAVQDGSTLYQRLTPAIGLGLPFMPTQVQPAYSSWPLLPDLFPVSFPGVKTSRDDVVVDIDRVRLEQRMRQYFDPAISHEDMRRIIPGAMTSTARFNAEATREQLREHGFRPENIVRYCYRPFDVRWLYWESETKLLDEKRAEYFPHVFPNNIWIEARQKQPMERFDRGYVVRVLADNFGNGLSSFFPLFLRSEHAGTPLLDHSIAGGLKANLSEEAITYLSQMNCDEQHLFFHSLAILHAPAYRNENAGGLRQDWPRVPLPKSKDALLASAILGRQVAALLDSENGVKRVTSGTVRTELRPIAAITHMDGKSLNPASEDLKVTGGWGHAGQGGVTMPGKGRVVEREYNLEERGAILAGADALGLTGGDVFARLGETTCDVFLNDVALWKNVPIKVWDYTIGGYQVIKKWLSYRESKVLGRTLTMDEAREVTNIARRIAALLLLEPQLDANYQAVKQATYTLTPKKGAEDR